MLIRAVATYTSLSFRFRCFAAAIFFDCYAATIDITPVAASTAYATAIIFLRC